MAKTQEQRRAETRQQLLEAARDVVAERGIAGASVDAVAEAADRTSGALYSQFGGKEGLLVALLDAWKDATASVIAADFEISSNRDEQLTSLWRNFADPPAEGGDAWVLLEHELWLYACRHPGARPAVAARYQDARTRLAEAFPGAATGDGTASEEGLASLLLALVLGLEMQRRLDPGAISDDLAVAGLHALVEAFTPRAAR
ncbi:MAG TPA: helix-turn-helix domain-containing protein [Acidimicrobiales bacterium]|nr:helix-turn-helix domain-containing protein [Acidimicrobiales bacterium]